MKEKPIIFTAESVNAIRDGRKTQTRRPVKFALTSQSDGAKRRIFSERDIDEINQLLSIRQTHPLNIFAPYQVGDRLWVRETWRPYWESETAYAGLQYKAGGESVTATDYQIESVMNGTDNWRSPIFMPRWASRITLEVTAVRVERLQDISEEDAKAEGVAFSAVVPTAWDDKCIGRALHEQQGGSYLAGFYTAWEKLNGKRSPWANNDWVTVNEFNLLEVNQ